MAAPMRVQVEGLSELRRALGGSRVRLDAAVRSAAEQGAWLVSAAGRREVPRRTGRLASSIRTRMYKRSAAVIAGRGLKYGGVIHNGWPAHNIRANPYLDRAVKDSLPAIQRNYRTAVDQATRELR